MEDNFDIVKNLLEFNVPTETGPVEDWCYVVEIIKYKKEFPYLSKDSKVVDHYYIYSRDALDKYKDVIIEKCQMGTKAYIKIAKRDLREVALEVQKRVNMYIKKEQYRSVKKIYSRVCKYTFRTDSIWSLEPSMEIKSFLDSQKIKYLQIDSQLVCRPFNLAQVGALCKDQATVVPDRDPKVLLYCQ